MNRQEVLLKPFDIETHKNTFVNYLEVIILEDGTVSYAVPSHQEKLIMIACQKLQVTRQELNDLCPAEYYADFMTWLCKMSNCVALWNEHMVGIPNELQKEAINALAKHNLYQGKAFE